MDKLFLIRLSDRPWEVTKVTRKTDTCFTFSVNGTTYCITVPHTGEICWVAELAAYDKARVNEFRAGKANPGGYGHTRFKLVWRSELRQTLLKFIG